MIHRTVLLNLFIFLACMTRAHSQSEPLNVNSQKTFYPDSTRACDPATIFTIVEEMPQYTGGMRQLGKDLKESLELKADVNGFLFLNVSINCEGRAFAFQVIRTVNAETDQNIIDALAKLQNWKAGKQRGKLIDCNHTVAVKIKNGEIEVLGK